jgi:glutathione synthase/RimK-type ligase-like ATP-grasp enzyme
MKTLLAVGELRDWDSYKKFYRNRRHFSKCGFKFKSLDYADILKNKLPKVNTGELIVFFFFPFTFWDTKIETKSYKGVYGNVSFYDKFKDFWNNVFDKINETYSDKKISYVNHPSGISLDRDKEATKRLLESHGVTVPKPYFTRDFDKIMDLLDQGKKLFVKVRYGSMGKGITYLEKDRWETNFRFRNGKIVSKKSDYGWTFIDVTNKKRFLRELLKQDIVIEEAINPWLLKGRKFDLRLYVCFGKVIYVYPRSNDTTSVTTNISQGATGEGKEFLHSIPEKIIKEAEKSAILAAKAMNLNFAGVDIMPNIDCKGVTVIEVNTFPGFPKVKIFNLGKYLVKAICNKKWK